MIGSKYLAKVAEDKESKKIDALSALATAGGGVAGGIGGAVAGDLTAAKILGKRPGENISSRYFKTLQRLNDKLHAARLNASLSTGLAVNDPKVMNSSFGQALLKAFKENTAQVSDLEQKLNHRMKRLGDRALLLGKARDRGAIPGGIVGAIAGGTGAYLLTKPSTRAKIAKLFDK